MLAPAVGRDRTPTGTVVGCPEAVIDHHVMPGPELFAEFLGDLFEDRAFEGREDPSGEVDAVHAMSAEHLFVRAQPYEAAGCEGTGKCRLA